MTSDGELIQKGLSLLDKNRSLVVGVLFFVLAGLARMVAVRMPFAMEVLLSMANSFLLVGLALGWGASLWYRLLPGRIRIYFVTSAFIMVVWMLLRSARYRISALSDAAALMCWYGYYACHLGIVCLLFLTCVWLWEQNGHEARALRAIVLVTMVLVSIGLLSNGRHGLAFSFAQAAPGKNDPYAYGPLYYVAVALTYGLTGISVLLLVYLRKLPGLAGRSFVPLAILVASGLYARVTVFVFDPLRLPNPYLYPEIACFSLLLIEEWLVRCRLIPSNERYQELFEGMEDALCITDSHLNVVYQTTALPAESREELREALHAPQRRGSCVLRGQGLDVGYVFWATDLSLLDRMNSELMQASAELAGENELLEAQNELLARKARLEAREQVWDAAVQGVLPSIERLRSQLDGLGTEDPSNEDLALMCVRGTYVKRAINLRLLSQESEGALMSSELVLCIEESLRACDAYGVCGAVSYAGGQMDPTCAIGLYERFEQMLEELLPELSSVLVHVDVDGECIHLVLEPASLAHAINGMGVVSSEEDGALYASLGAQKRVYA